MPRAEDNSKPKGQPPGTLEKQAQIGAVAPDTSQESPFAAGGSSGTEQGESMFGAAPGAVSSPVNQPQITPEPTWQPPKEAPEQPNIDPVSGMNYDEILHGPTQRPLEPVTTGAGHQGQSPGQPVSAALQTLASLVPSRDIQALLNAAKNVGA